MGEAERLAAAGQAGKDKHVGVEASRKAATGQNGKNTRAAGEAKRCANKKSRSSVANAMEDEPRHCAPRNCAPRTSRSANFAAQSPPRNSRRAAAPTHRVNSFTPNQYYHFCLPPGPVA